MPSLSLDETQQLLAQIYTNRKVREQFFTNPAQFARNRGLEAPSIQKLSTLDRAQVEFFASSLIHKRLNQVSKLLPLTQKALGRDFSRLFVEYAETYIPSGIKKYWLDALAYAYFLQRTPLDYDWQSDVVRYERENLQQFKAKLRFSCYRSRYTLQPLIASLQQSPETPVVIPKHNFILQLKIGAFQWTSA